VRRHQAQRAFKILGIEYTEPITKSKQKRRVQDWQGSPEEKKKRRAEHRQSEQAKASRTPVSARLGPPPIAAPSAPSVEEISTSEPESFAPPPSMAGRVGPKETGYAVPPVFLGAIHFIKESHKFLSSITSLDTHNPIDLHHDLTQAKQMIQGAQKMAGQIEKEMHQLEEKVKADRKLKQGLMNEIIELRDSLERTDDKRVNNVQREYLKAMHQLSGEALKSFQQPNQVDVKVVITTIFGENEPQQTEVGSESEIPTENVTVKKVIKKAPESAKKKLSFAEAKSKTETQDTTMSEGTDCQDETEQIAQWIQKGAQEPAPAVSMETEDPEDTLFRAASPFQEEIESRDQPSTSRTRDTPSKTKDTKTRRN